jgi:two-component system sensor histidine kinase DegS
LKLNVEDDGIGFDVQEALARRDSFGLAGMRERVTLLGGRFEVTSNRASKQGTTVRIDLPIPWEG